MTWFRVAVLRCPLDNIIQIQSGAWVGWPMSCGGRLLRADFSLGLQQPVLLSFCSRIAGTGHLGI